MNPLLLVDLWAAYIVYIAQQIPVAIGPAYVRLANRTIAPLPLVRQVQTTMVTASHSTTACSLSVTKSTLSGTKAKETLQNLTMRDTEPFASARLPTPA